MSSHSHEEGGFHPHINPLWVYMAVFGALLVCTVITVLAAQLPLKDLLGEQKRIVALVIAMAVAIVKATLVAAIFMHLWYDNKFYFLLFTLSVLFLGIFIIFIYFDIHFRSELNPENDMDPVANGDFIKHDSVSGWRNKVNEDKLLSNNGKDRKILAVVHEIDVLNHHFHYYEKKLKAAQDKEGKIVDTKAKDDIAKTLPDVIGQGEALQANVKKYSTSKVNSDILVGRVEKIVTGLKEINEKVGGKSAPATPAKEPADSDEKKDQEEPAK